MGGERRYFWIPKSPFREGEEPTRWRLQVGSIRVEVFRRSDDHEGWRAEAKYLCGGAGVIYDHRYFRVDLDTARRLAVDLAMSMLKEQFDGLKKAQIRELVFSEVPPNAEAGVADEEARS